MKKTTLSIGSATYAMKIRRLLINNGIDAELVKVGTIEDKATCNHGIEVNSSDMFAVAKILRDASIPYKVYGGK